MPPGAHERVEIGISDPYERFLRMIPMLAEAARNAAEFDAYSYRGFKVGAAAVVADSYTSGFKIYGKGNLKPKSSKNKICAEKRVLNEIERDFEERRNSLIAREPFHSTSSETDYGEDYRTWEKENVVGLVVAATTDREKIAAVSDYPTPTLHPCGDECRSELLVGREDMLLVTTGLEGEGTNIYQANRVGDLLYHYKEGNTHHLMNNVRTFDDWDDRVRMYRDLRRAETTVKPHRQRSLSQLALMTLTAA